MADSEEKKPKKTRKRQRIEETIRASDPWEPVGQTPMPDIPDLRNWDMRLMKTYPPLYAPFCDVCCFCTYGKCDLTAGRRGGCGIDIAGQQGRIVLLAACMGLSAHGAHARHVIDHLIEHHGEDLKIDLGGNVAVEAPNIRLVLGLKPETLKDLRTAVEYVEGELIHLISVASYGPGRQQPGLRVQGHACQHAGPRGHGSRRHRPDHRLQVPHLRGRYAAGGPGLRRSGRRQADDHSRRATTRFPRRPSSTTCGRTISLTRWRWAGCAAPPTRQRDTTTTPGSSARSRGSSTTSGPASPMW